MSPFSPEAFGILQVDEERVTESTTEIVFRVKLRREQMRQSVFCGLVTPDYRGGVAISLDPVSGGIVDVINGAGPMGYLTVTPILPDSLIPVEIQLQKYGANYICSLKVFDEVVMYPSFVSQREEVFKAVVGSDIDSGSRIVFEDEELQVGSSRSQNAA